MPDNEFTQSQSSGYFTEERLMMQSMAREFAQQEVLTDRQQARS